MRKAALPILLAALAAACADARTGSGPRSGPPAPEQAALADTASQEPAAGHGEWNAACAAQKGSCEVWG